MKYEKWSLGYWLLKKYVSIADFIIHKRVILTGKENIPKDKAILFAPNHQNALSDPMAVLLHTPYQPVWLARADIFKNKIAALILRFMKIMPVYRIRDGKDQLSKNDTTFENSIKVLKNNGALALFPEAAHSGKRQMLTHKKAVPRIVFLAEEKAKDNIDIHIIPTGIYYSSYWKFNRTVIVNFGKPVRVNEYLEEYRQNPNSATMALRDQLSEAIDKQIINIRSKVHYYDFERIRTIYGKEYLKRQGKKYSAVNLFRSDQQLCRKLDKLGETSPETTETLTKATNSYQQLLKKYHLRNWLIDNPQNNFLKILRNLSALILGLPFFIYGFILNSIPFIGIDILVRKKVKDFAFWSSFSLALGLVLFPIVYVLELWALSGFVSGIGLKVAFFVTLPFFGKLAFLWYILFRKTWGRLNLLYLKHFNKKTFKIITGQRNNLFEKLNSFISI